MGGAIAHRHPLSIFAGIEIREGVEPPAGIEGLIRARGIRPLDRAYPPRLDRVLEPWRRKDARLARQAARYNPKPGLFYFTLAEQMEERRRFDVAEKYYQQAIELRPTLAVARNSLGLLYMRLGREKEAAAELKKSFKADPFNVRVANSLKVLHHLEGYETLKTKQAPKPAGTGAGYDVPETV